jgi:hypothetical protein
MVESETFLNRHFTGSQSQFSLTGIPRLALAMARLLRLTLQGVVRSFAEQFQQPPKLRSSAVLNFYPAHAQFAKPHENQGGPVKMVFEGARNTRKMLISKNRGSPSG